MARWRRTKPNGRAKAPEADRASVHAAGCPCGLAHTLDRPGGRTANLARTLVRTCRSLASPGIPVATRSRPPLSKISQLQAESRRCEKGLRVPVYRSFILLR